MFTYKSCPSSHIKKRKAERFLLTLASLAFTGQATEHTTVNGLLLLIWLSLTSLGYPGHVGVHLTVQLLLSTNFKELTPSVHAFSLLCKLARDK